MYTNGTVSMQFYTHHTSMHTTIHDHKSIQFTHVSSNYTFQATTALPQSCEKEVSKALLKDLGIDKSNRPKEGWKHHANLGYLSATYPIRHYVILCAHIMALQIYAMYI